MARRGPQAKSELSPFGVAVERAMEDALARKLPGAPDGRQALADRVADEIPKFNYRRLFTYTNEGKKVPADVAGAIARVLGTTSEALMSTVAPDDDSSAERVKKSPYTEFEKYITDHRLMETKQGREYAREIRSIYYLEGAHKATYTVAEGIHRGAVRRDTGLAFEQVGTVRESREEELSSAGKVAAPIGRKGKKG